MHFAGTGKDGARLVTLRGLRDTDAGTAVPLIAPVEGSAMLAVTKEGAELLRSGMGGSPSNPDPLVAPVVVIVRRK